MNDLMKSTDTMSSLEIAELTGKQHGHVMRDCRVMFEAIGVGDSKFGFTRLIKGLGDNPDRSVKYYNLDKELTLTLISGYNIEMRYAIIRRWQELEAANTAPPPPPKTALEQAAETMAMLTKEIIAEKEETAILNQFIDNTMGHENLVTFETAAKLMYDRFAFQIGRNTLMKCLRDVGVLMDNNNPYQRYSHWFKVIKKEAPNGGIYNVTLIYEDKIKMIYKYAMKEFKTI